MPHSFQVMRGGEHIIRIVHESQPDSRSAGGPATRRLILLGFLVLAALLVHVGIGSYFWLSPWRVAAEVFRGNIGSDPVNTVVWNIRLPRALACVFVGAI